MSEIKRRRKKERLFFPLCVWRGLTSKCLHAWFDGFWFALICLHFTQVFSHVLIKWQRWELGLHIHRGSSVSKGNNWGHIYTQDDRAEGTQAKSCPARYSHLQSSALKSAWFHLSYRVTDVREKHYAWLACLFFFLFFYRIILFRKALSYCNKLTENSKHDPS